jgi:hypothetical protein
MLGFARRAAGPVTNGRGLATASGAGERGSKGAGGAAHIMWSTLCCAVGFQSVQYSREATAAQAETAQLRSIVVVPEDLLRGLRDEVAAGRWAEELLASPAGKELAPAVLKHKVLAVLDNFSLKTLTELKARAEVAREVAGAAKPTTAPAPAPAPLKIDLK